MKESADRKKAGHEEGEYGAHAVPPREPPVYVREADTRAIRAASGQGVSSP
ncbi:hypothetical protein [Nonomuraea sp. CA-141351]|uniref:hypothetical protein n=1 Tax=Nonomuraea sp. CA-141351 TaxID=3239996 RepID=UPI003D94076A